MNEKLSPRTSVSAGILVWANKLIQNTSNDTRQVVRVVLVCPLINEKKKGRRTVVSWVAVEGCETLTITMPTPIAVSWVKQERLSAILRVHVS